MDALRDPAAGVLLSLVSLIAGGLLYRLGKTRKEMGYEVLTVTQLLTPREELEGHLQILFDGEEVRDVSLVLVQVFNSGNEAITAEDFVRPMTLGVAGKLLSAEVVERVPEELDVSVALLGNRCHLAPALMNAGDVLTLRLVVSEFHAPIAIDTRIVGVPRVRSVTGSTVAMWTLLAVAAGFVGAATAVALLAIAPGVGELRYDLRVGVAVLVMLVGGGGAFFAVSRAALGPRARSRTYRQVVSERERARRRSR